MDRKARVLRIRLHGSLGHPSSGMSPCRWIAPVMAFKVALATGAAMLIVALPARATEPTCGGVAMPIVLNSSFDMTIGPKLGVFSIDGGPFKDGKNTCQAIHIDCLKQTGSCQTATAAVMVEQDRHPRIIGIFVSDEMKINRWTEDEIIASGQTHLCKWSQLFVNYKSRKVRVVETSGAGCKGGPVIDVLDVQSDPLYLEQPVAR
jgi:hypothetical protein